MVEICRPSAAVIVVCILLVFAIQRFSLFNSLVLQPVITPILASSQHSMTPVTTPAAPHETATLGREIEAADVVGTLEPVEAVKLGEVVQPPESIKPLAALKPVDAGMTASPEAHVPAAKWEDVSVLKPAQASAVAVAKSLRIFVYDLSDVKKAQRPNEEDERNQNDWHEKFFIQLFNSSAQRVYDPKSADFFFVPANLLNYFGRKRSSRLSFPPFEAEVLQALRRVGPYWDKHQDRHIVSKLKCPFKSKRHAWDNFFPTLWGSSHALFLCLEADLVGMDMKRALHSAYYVREDWWSNNLMSRVGKSSSRDLLAMYAGAKPNPAIGWKAMPIRVEIWQGLSKCKDCAVLPTASNFKRGSPAMSFYTKLYELLGRSRFQLVPPGDTIERSSRDQSIAMGSVPVYFGQFRGVYHALPWCDIVDWSAFSVNFTRPVSYKNFWSDLEGKLRQLVRSGEADRLLAGVAKVQQRFRWSHDGVFQTMLEQLALVKMGWYK